LAALQLHSGEQGQIFSFSCRAMAVRTSTSQPHRTMRVSATAELDLQDIARNSQQIVVSCCTRFDNLAHGPRGKEARRSLYTFRLDPGDG